MIAKVCIFLAFVAAASAVGLGIGAPLLAPGHLGVGLVSAQSTAINHVAPARVAVAAAPLALGHGIAAPAALGYGIAAPGVLGYGVGALGLGHGLVGGNLRADGVVGHGVLGARYGSAIAHNAVVGHGVGVLGYGHGIGLGKAIL